MRNPKLICPFSKKTIGFFDNGQFVYENHSSVLSSGFKTIEGVPNMRGGLDEEEKINFLEEAQLLPRQDSYDLDIPLIREALSSNEFVLELGAGVDKCDNPKLIKTDAYLYSTDLHCIADAHSLPFEDDTFGYVYSLAVFEHLHSPWVAAEEIYRVLKPGGKVFTLTAFMQHLHGYPNHFFNMTTSGLKRVFNSFEVVHCKPSKHSNISQLGHILADLNQFIVDSNFKQTTQKKFLELRESIGDFCNLIAELDVEIMGNFEAQLTSFSKFCPAVELVGIKKA